MRTLSSIKKLAYGCLLARVIADYARYIIASWQSNKSRFWKAVLAVRQTVSRVKSKS